MSNEIINKVAESSLKIFNLEDYYQEGNRVQIDISQWLSDGYLLKEKDFRENLKNFNWETYSNQYVALHCSTDAILPAWAYQLVTVYLLPFAKKVILGTQKQLDVLLYTEVLLNLDYTEFKDKPIILKGCAKKPVPEEAYILALSKLQPIAKSIMYGEACSAVPLFKSKK